MVKAINTDYAGCRFRSRLEARYAVFFDSLGIPWEYENEGYQLSSGWYLPDFWIPNAMPEWPYAGYWVEIKPANVSKGDFKDAQRKLAELTNETKHTSHIVCGLPNDCKIYFYNFFKQEWILDNDIAYPVGYEDPVLHHFVYGLTHERPLIETRKAVKAAMSARFEHGESGAPK